MISTLYLIPSPLGETFQEENFSVEIKSIIEKLDYFIVENEKVSRAFIKLLAPNKKQETLKFFLNQFFY